MAAEQGSETLRDGDIDTSAEQESLEELTTSFLVAAIRAVDVAVALFQLVDTFVAERALEFLQGTTGATVPLVRAVATILLSVADVSGSHALLIVALELSQEVARGIG
jgi:hypothetical protein